MAYRSLAAHFGKFTMWSLRTSFMYARAISPPRVCTPLIRPPGKHSHEVPSCVDGRIDATSNSGSFFEGIRLRNASCSVAGFSDALEL